MTKTQEAYKFLTCVWINLNLKNGEKKLNNVSFLFFKARHPFFFFFNKKKKCDTEEEKKIDNIQIFLPWFLSLYKCVRQRRMRDYRIFSRKPPTFSIFYSYFPFSSSYFLFKVFVFDKKKWKETKGERLKGKTRRTTGKNLKFFLESFVKNATLLVDTINVNHY